MLKYCFNAFFQDGTILGQTPEDLSLLDPEKRSRFYDVCEKEKENPLVKFEMRGEGHVYLVDLIDGHFEVDGVSFVMHEEELSGFKLIYYRRHTHNFIVGREKKPEETLHDISFRMGWQCTVDGKNYQRVMQIN